MSGVSTSFIIHRGTRARSGATVEIAGELDAGTAPGFRAVMRDFVGERVVTLDLSRCSFIDATGIGVLAGAARRIRDAGGTARIVAAPAGVRLALAAARADSLLAAPDHHLAAAG